MEGFSETMGYKVGDKVRWRGEIHTIILATAAYLLDGVVMVVTEDELQPATEDTNENTIKREDDESNTEQGQ